MKTLTLKIEDSAVDKVMWVLEHLKDVVKIEAEHTFMKMNESSLNDDPLAQELKRRVQEINDGAMPVTPYDDVMGRIYAKWEAKCM